MSMHDLGKVFRQAQERTGKKVSDIAALSPVFASELSETTVRRALKGDAKGGRLQRSTIITLARELEVHPDELAAIGYVEEAERLARDLSTSRTLAGFYSFELEEELVRRGWLSRPDRKQPEPEPVEADPWDFEVTTTLAERIEELEEQ